MSLLLRALGVILEAIFFVAALFFYALYVVVRELTIWVMRQVAMQRAAKSDRG